MDQKRMAQCFNEWMDRYTKDPEKFMREFESVLEFSAERAEGKEPTYGGDYAAYLAKLDAELPA